MAQQGQNNATLRRFTQERFKEEVARELGIDLNATGFPERDIQKLEADLHADGESETEP